jgi:hypothetical protein
MKLKTQDYNYSPSVNIIRDKDREIAYIPTINGQRSFEQIVESSRLGARAFTLVGAYGTGKSTFMWALAKAVEKNNDYFDHFDYILRGYTEYELLDLVGEHSSVKEAFSKALRSNNDDVLIALDDKAKTLQAENKALIIRIDEFGKFLEYAAKNNPEADFYFLQQLAEIVNDQQRNLVLITTLHQDFAAYAYQLSDANRKEWLKVKGRFKEIPFNEPAEQLLLIAGEKLKNNNYQVDAKTITQLLKTIERAKAFPLKDYFNKTVANNLAPLDLLSGSILTLALQRYGQNERSLFTFLEFNDYNGIGQFLNEGANRFYSLSHVYDYLVYHFYAQLTVHQNPDYRAWRLMLDNIERVEGLLDGDQLILGRHLVKIIGLLSLFGRKSLIVDEQFLTDYSTITLGLYDAKDTLRLMEHAKVVRYRAHNSRYVLIEGTDVDIDSAIEEAKYHLPEITSISQYINKTFSFPAMLAKKYLLEKGTPRYFEFKLSDEPLSKQPKDEVDGFINLVFSTTSSEESIRLVSDVQQEAILYVYFKNTNAIVEQIQLIEQLKIARNKYEGDRVARNEFDTLYAHHSELLKKYVLGCFNEIDPTQIKLYYKGEDLATKITDRKSLNTYLSHIVSDIYRDTPYFLNEMVNKTRLSAAISTARKTLFTQLILQSDQENLGYASHLFPPDKTIYLALLKQNGFHRAIDGHWQLAEPTTESFGAIWAIFIAFLHSAKQAKRSLQDLVEQLAVKPFKVKKGLVDFLLPLFLLVKKENYALYYQGTRFIPELTIDTLELLIRKPADYSIKAFNIEGLRLEVFNHYRDLLSQATSDTLSSKSFIDTIVPFLTFYRDLPVFAQKTNKITKEAQRLREAITKATDPEKSFFEDFPQAIGYSMAELNKESEKLNVYFDELRHAIKEIQLSYDALLERYESYITTEVLGLRKEMTFEAWREKLQQRFKQVKAHVMAPHLKTFLQRINSPLDDKKAWLSSVAQVLLGKSLEQIQDHEEEVLHRKFKDWVEELDNYTDIVKEVNETDLNHAFKIQLTNIGTGTQSRVVKVNKSKFDQVVKKQELMAASLTDDKNLNIFILTRMLEEQLKK